MQYIGTKIIHAEPCPAWKDAGDHKVGDDGYKVVYPDGYESWSPKDVFEEAYRQTDGMNFGLALEAAKMGKRIARKNWNGKNQYVFLATDVDFHTDADLSAFADKFVTVHDALVIKTSQDVFQPGWLASQSDMLADDWYIVDED